MESIEPPAWGPPVAYVYTLKLDEVSRAWEYLRRNRQYRSEFFCVTRRGQRNLRPSFWGLAHWEDPREDSRAAEPAWLSVANAEIVLTQGDGSKKAPSFDLWKLPGRKTLIHDGEYVRLTARRGSQVLYRVRWPESLTHGDPLSVSVAGGRGFSVRARAAQRFLQSLSQDPCRGIGRTHRAPFNQCPHSHERASGTRWRCGGGKSPEDRAAPLRTIGKLELGC